MSKSQDYTIRYCKDCPFFREVVQFPIGHVPSYCYLWKDEGRLQVDRMSTPPHACPARLTPTIKLRLRDHD